MEFDFEKQGEVKCMGNVLLESQRIIWILAGVSMAFCRDQGLLGLAGLAGLANSVLVHGPAREMRACAPDKMYLASHPITLVNAEELMHLRRL